MRVVVSVLVIVCSATVASAEPRGAELGRMDAGFLEQVAIELKVDDATLAKIKDRIYAAEKEHIELRAQAGTARLELRRMLDADQPERAKVLKQVDVVGEIETKLRKNRIGLLLSVRELLTPEQRGKLERMLASRKHERGRHRGDHGPDDE
jgi:Spy/CpxP family protein refolding chaperone